MLAIRWCNGGEGTKVVFKWIAGIVSKDPQAP